MSPKTKSYLVKIFRRPSGITLSVSGEVRSRTLRATSNPPSPQYTNYPPPPMPPAQPLARASPGDGGGGGGAPSTSDEGRERKSSRPSRRQRRCGHCGARATPERQLKACARCFGAHYCSRACQEKAWSQHRVRSAPPHLIDAHRIPSYPMSCGAHPRISPHAHVHAIDISCRSVSCRSVAPRLHTAPWTWPVARRASQLTPTK